MTLSKERLEEIATETPESHQDNPCRVLTVWEAMAMARELLERRERDKQEPVAWRMRYRSVHCIGGWVFSDTYGEPPKGYENEPLYAAPPAPVVPDANYQQLSELYHAQEKRIFKIAQRIKGPSFDKYAYSPSQAIDVLEVAIFGESNDGSAAALNQTHVKQPASNGVQSFGNSEQLEPVSQPYKLRDGLAAIRKLGPIDAEKIQAERDALNEPTCWCLTCRPVMMTDMRFVVCPECGNKRCPKANDHRNPCSGSNEPGQDGSSYPAAPKQESE